MRVGRRYVGHVSRVDRMTRDSMAALICPEVDRVPGTSVVCLPVSASTALRGDSGRSGSGGVRSGRPAGVTASGRAGVSYRNSRKVQRIAARLSNCSTSSVCVTSLSHGNFIGGGAESRTPVCLNSAPTSAMLVGGGRRVRRLSNFRSHFCLLRSAVRRESDPYYRQLDRVTTSTNTTTSTNNLASTLQVWFS